MALYALVVPVLLASSGFVTTGYIDDNTTFSLAISVSRGAVGPHARALRMEADVNGIEIHAPLVTNMPATATFTRDLNGLQRRLGAIDINATMGAPSPAPFAIADVDWAILGKLEERAIDKAAVLHGLVNRVSVAISADQPAGPVLIWTVEVTDPTGEVTKSLLMRRGSLPGSY